MRTKKYLNLSIDAELLERVRPYIKNLSSFMEQCLINYVSKNKEIMQSDDIRTANYLLNPVNESDLSNIKFNEQTPQQLKLFEIVDNRVISQRKEKVLTYPTSEDFYFSSNNTCVYKKKKYYFERLAFSEKNISLKQKLSTLEEQKKRKQEEERKEDIFLDSWW